MTIYNEPPPGMCIVPDKDDMTKVCCAFMDHTESDIYVTYYNHFRYVILFVIAL